MDLNSISYVAGTVTLTDAGSNYNLLELLKAAVIATYPGLPGMCCDVLLYGDDANDPANPILLGDAALSATNYGFPLTPGASRRYGPFVASQFPMANLFARSVVAGQKLHIEMVVT